MLIMEAVAGSTDPVGRGQKLGIENRGAGGAPLGVVDQCHIAEVEDRTASDPTDGHRHAVFPVGVELGLRPRSIVGRHHRTPWG